MLHGVSSYSHFPCRLKKGCSFFGAHRTEMSVACIPKSSLKSCNPYDGSTVHTRVSLRQGCPSTVADCKTRFVYGERNNRWQFTSSLLNFKPILCEIVVTEITEKKSFLKAVVWCRQTWSSSTPRLTSIHPRNFARFSVTAVRLDCLNHPAHYDHSMNALNGGIFKQTNSHFQVTFHSEWLGSPDVPVVAHGSQTVGGREHFQTPYKHTVTKSPKLL